MIKLVDVFFWMLMLIIYVFFLKVFLEYGVKGYKMFKSFYGCYYFKTLNNLSVWVIKLKRYNYI